MRELERHAKLEERKSMSSMSTRACLVPLGGGVLLYKWNTIRPHRRSELYYINNHTNNDDIDVYG